MNLEALRAKAAERLQPGDGYAGEVTPSEAWQILESEDDAALIDVRTDAEWAYVGVPDLGSLGKAHKQVSWQVFPAMEENSGFVGDVAESGATKEASALFLCRSGARSKAAAIACAAAGWSRAYNVIDGFEGPRDGDGHRGTQGGWKASGLPWRQS